MITQTTFFRHAFIVLRVKDSPAPYMVNRFDLTKVNARAFVEYLLGLTNMGTKRIAWISQDTYSESAEAGGVIAAIVPDMTSELLPIEQKKDYVRPVFSSAADLEVVFGDKVNPLDERWEAGYRLLESLDYTIAEDFSIDDLNNFLTFRSYKWNVKVKQWVIA